ncbi:hypothetical protein E5288_WYG008578 [Bos mutus]|uniref:Uncharacterized protein n=1 Tax=Bos mutus TaxID=72004 RepID=A0A6B0SI42_9CETA|nr:hypothetical protein [Bos mutus]
MLTSHWDGTRVRWSSPRQGERTADARGTTDTGLPAAEMVGPGLQSRRVERAEGTDPSPAPEDVTKHNDRRPTPGSEAQPHPRTGQGASAPGETAIQASKLLGLNRNRSKHS